MVIDFIFISHSALAVEQANKYLVIEQLFDQPEATNSTTHIFISQLDSNGYTTSIRARKKDVSNVSAVLGISQSEFDNLISVNYNQYDSFPQLLQVIDRDQLYKNDFSKHVQNIAILFGTNVRKWMIANNLDMMFYTYRHF